MENARCNICSQRIKDANDDKIRKHYKTFHNCSPLQECERCEEEKVLVETARKQDGTIVVIADSYCEDCKDPDFPLEELLVREVAVHE